MTAGRLGSACSLRSRRSNEARAGTVPEPSREQSTLVPSFMANSTTTMSASWGPYTGGCMCLVRCEGSRVKQGSTVTGGHADSPPHSSSISLPNTSDHSSPRTRLGHHGFGARVEDVAGGAALRLVDHGGAGSGEGGRQPASKLLNVGGPVGVDALALHPRRRRSTRGARWQDWQLTGAGSAHAGAPAWANVRPTTQQCPAASRRAPAWRSRVPH